MRHPSFLLGLFATTALAALPDRGASTIPNSRLGSHSDLPLDGTSIAIERYQEATVTPGFSGYAYRLILSGDVQALAGSMLGYTKIGYRNPFVLWVSESGILSAHYVLEVRADSLLWGSVKGKQASWAFAHEIISSSYGSSFGFSAIAYRFCGESGCRTNRDTVMVCRSEASCDSLLKAPFCRDTACVKGRIEQTSWNNKGDFTLRRLHARLDSTRSYVRWLDTLGTLGDRWEMFLRSWRGGPLAIGSVKGTLHQADGKALATTFQPSATLAFTRTPIPQATPTAPARGTILYSQKVSIQDPSTTTGSLSNALVDTSGHLYAKATIQWVDDSLAPRGKAPQASDTGSHPGWLRAVAKWTFTVDGKKDSVFATGWVPDPEVSKTTRTLDRKRSSGKTPFDVLGRPAELRHRASDVRLVKP